jgi:AcrR family transcriptional regulator
MVREYSLTMVGATETTTREKLVEAAVELFSTKGYDATSVADIQLACGLTAGSGALYKHFPSKQALLEEVLRRHLDDVAAIRDALVPEMISGLHSDAGNLETILRIGARAIWESMEHNRAVVRITIRDLEPYPELLDEVWDGIFQDVYRQATQLIEGVLASGTIEVADPEATAAVLLASLTYFPILHGLIGRTPGDLDPDRYLDAWIDHAMRTVLVNPDDTAT